MRLHPNLPELYRHKVAQLRDALQDPSIHDEALGLLRGLIAKVTVRPGEGYVESGGGGGVDGDAGPGLREPGRGVRVLFWKYGEGGCGGRI